MELLAPAKINLVLKILARRDNGYHDLFTVMQKVDLCDRLLLEPSPEPGIKLFCPDSDLPEDDSNLVFRAALRFFELRPELAGQGVRITLEKKIPVGAGLGGGSSDCAATLTGLNRLFGSKISLQRLLQLGEKLGADVPFFIAPYPAVRAEGIGELMTPVAPLEYCRVVLVNPGIHVSTAWVYQNYRLTNPALEDILTDFEKNDCNQLLSGPLENDLEQVTAGRFEEIDEIKKSLLETGALAVLMSGSGPTVFGLFIDKEDSQFDGDGAMMASLQQRFGEHVYITKPITGAWPSGEGTRF
ncbi:MAG: 4-(cytidine 5'-diphospho)-2-C-methyl-D-erythritol kinase [Thermodesulfobacteriota bacterium]